MDLIRYQMALGVVKYNMPARHHFARCVVEGRFVGCHAHFFV